MADSRAVAEAAQDALEYLVSESKEVLTEPETCPRDLAAIMDELPLA